ncbi:hypothetical protein BDD12DRAFT_808743 [Trichophaea hybrida]|nr:hypothetical protein BDD12DRAFT_808743 [Trichophaea hybrida]
MAQTISPGAYVIRNLDSSAVLHADAYGSGTCLTISGRHEEHYREHQIWWIEADPGFEDFNNCDSKTTKGGSVYRIANIAKDISLDVECGRGDDGAPVIVYKSHGAPWQLWNFIRLPSYTEGEYYSIISVHSGLALDASQAQCCTRRLDANSEKQVWELQKPVVSVPAGWLRLQIAASGHLLSQTYPSLPPLAISVTIATSAPLTYRDSWATQWAFVQASAVKTYLIKNRLTGTYLRCQLSNLIHRGEKAGSVNAWEVYCYGMKSELWNLELDAESNWKIVHNSGFLLEEAVVPLLDGYEIVCTTKGLDKRKSWTFIPPNSAIERFAGLVRNSDPGLGS